MTCDESSDIRKYFTDRNLHFSAFFTKEIAAIFHRNADISAEDVDWARRILREWQTEEPNLPYQEYYNNNALKRKYDPLYIKPPMFGYYPTRSENESNEQIPKVRGLALHQENQQENQRRMKKKARRAALTEKREKEINEALSLHNSLPGPSDPGPSNQSAIRRSKRRSKRGSILRDEEKSGSDCAILSDGRLRDRGKSDEEQNEAGNMPKDDTEFLPGPSNRRGRRGGRGRGGRGRGPSNRRAILSDEGRAILPDGRLRDRRESGEEWDKAGNMDPSDSEYELS